ncbi:hypothetical protein HDV00_005222 [Rhizophlyctis rosea]|nr:hypothetical protein HDV00_005222 [Rhizophlyctis rosea]
MLGNNGDGPSLLGQNFGAGNVMSIRIFLRLVELASELRIKDIRAMIPQIVVVGNESSGKSALISALIQRLTGKSISLISDARVATRAPFVIKIKSDETAKYDNKWAPTEDTPVTVRIRKSATHPWQEVSIQVVTERLLALQDELCGDSGFSMNPIHIEISGGKYDVTFVDTPGYRTDDSKADLANIIKKFATPMNATIIQVNQADVTTGSNPCYHEIISKLDEDGSRTVVVVQQSDLLLKKDGAHKLIEDYNKSKAQKTIFVSALYDEDVMSSPLFHDVHHGLAALQHEVLRVQDMSIARMDISSVGKRVVEELTSINAQLTVADVPYTDSHSASNGCREKVRAFIGDISIKSGATGIPPDDRVNNPSILINKRIRDLQSFATDIPFFTETMFQISEELSDFRDPHIISDSDAVIVQGIVNCKNIQTEVLKGLREFIEYVGTIVEIFLQKELAESVAIRPYPNLVSAMKQEIMVIIRQRKDAAHTRVKDLLRAEENVLFFHKGIEKGKDIDIGTATLADEWFLYTSIRAKLLPIVEGLIDGKKLPEPTTIISHSTIPLGSPNGSTSQERSTWRSWLGTLQHSAKQAAQLAGAPPGLNSTLVDAVTSLVNHIESLESNKSTSTRSAPIDECLPYPVQLRTFQLTKSIVERRAQASHLVSAYAYFLVKLRRILDHLSRFSRDHFLYYLNRMRKDGDDFEVDLLDRLLSGRDSVQLMGQSQRQIDEIAEMRAQQAKLQEMAILLGGGWYGRGPAGDL